MAFAFPPVYLLKTIIEKDPQELHRLEREICPVWNTKEAKIFLGRITKKSRAVLELRKLGVNTRDVHGQQDGNPSTRSRSPSSRPTKRRKIDRDVVDGKEAISLDSDTASDDDGSRFDATQLSEQGSSPISSKADDLLTARTSSPPRVRNRNHIYVLHLDWYAASLEAGKLLPYEDYLIYQGELLSSSQEIPSDKSPILKGSTILARAKQDAPPPAKRVFGQRTAKGHQSSSQPPLLHETTTEHDGMPPIPDSLQTRYSCQRSTPLRCPNEAFIAQLRILRQARLLEGEPMSSKAYNGAIATIAAYPHNLMSAMEVHRLPQCGDKIAQIWQEWHESGHIAEVDEIDSDGRMQSLRIFYGIHDVGEGNAKKFYDKGWRDLDDVIQYGWEDLTRNQKIGVKYYDEFQARIPRSEVKSTAEIVLYHANRIRDGFQMVICGGYRRGKPDCGDVDVILSHPEESGTEDFLETLLESLENELYITHTLTLATTNSKRGQSPVAWKGGMRKAGSGFDTLDHAFVVWQNPDWPTRDKDLENDPEATNPNPHRRVDIIISPWKTAGCAVIGWSGGTMFERDLRHYCKYVKDLKFDSSGVRTRTDGSWVDLEVGDGDLLEKEKRVFSGLGLEWIEPTERCTD